MDDFEIAVRGIVIADEGAAIHPDRHRAVLAHIAGFVGSRCESRFRTGQIRTEGRFQVVICRVVIANDSLPSCDGDRGILADVPLSLQKRENSNGRGFTGHISAVRNLQVAVRDIIIGDER